MRISDINELNSKFETIKVNCKEAIWEIPLISEPTWILRRDFRFYFNNEGELDKINANNIVYIESDSNADLDSFICGVSTYTHTVNLNEHILLSNQ